MKRYLVSERISLHGLRPEDLLPDAPYYAWLEDLSLDAFTEHSMFPNSVARMRDYYEEATRNNTRVLLGIYDNASDSHIGNITLQQINWVNRSASVAYLIGERSFEGRGIATEAVRMVMYYGFNRLNLERLHAGVSARHAASRRVLEKSGMRAEGRLRGALLRNGERTDVMLFGGLRDEWMAELGDSVKRLFVVPPTY